MNCEDAQIALAKEPLGLLDQEARRLLEHHLAECEACTKMYALSVALEDLKHTPVPSIPHIDTILTRQWLRERILMARAVTLVASVVALLWLFGTTTLVLTVSGAVALAAVSALWIIGRRRLARFHRLARDPSPGSFFNALKGYLEQELANRQRAPLGGVGLLAIGAIGALSPATGDTWHFLLVTGALLTGVGLYVRHTDGRRLQAEIAELAKN